MATRWKNVKDGCHLTVLFAVGVLAVFADMNQTQGFRNILTSAIMFVASTGRQFDHIKHQYAKMVSDELSKPLCRKSTSAVRNKQNVSSFKIGDGRYRSKILPSGFLKRSKHILMIDSLLARKQATRHHLRKLLVKCSEKKVI